MLTLKAKKREITGKKVKKLRRQSILPAVLYGPKVKNLSLEIELKEFETIYKEAGESSLISLQVSDKKFPVLIHEIKKDPLTSKPTHVDFYHPILTKEVEVTVPLVFEGGSLAVKDLGGTLIREIQELEVKALPEKLPHEIKVNIESLKTFEDEILIKDLKLPEGVKIQREPDEIVAIVAPPAKVEEELEKPIEEKVEEVEKVEEKKEREMEEKEEEPKLEKKEEKEKSKIKDQNAK